MEGAAPDSRRPQNSWSTCMQTARLQVSEARATGSDEPKMFALDNDDADPSGNLTKHTAIKTQKA
jgi:hypothetical protein